MDATKLLTRQHREVEDLFEDYEDASDVSEKETLFTKIADNLAAHATIEEKMFYPRVYVGELQDLLKEAVEEHLVAKRLIADLLAMDPAEDNFDAKVKVLQEAIEHHVEEEEGELFAKVRKELSKAELETLGTEMEFAFKELIQTSPRLEIPSETATAAPLS